MKSKNFSKFLAPGGPPEASPAQGKRAVRFHDLPELPGVGAVEGIGVTNDFPRHVHRRYVVGLAESGERSTRINGALIPIPAGSLFLLNPDTPHACAAREHEYRLVAVSRERMRALACDPAREGDSPDGPALPAFNTVTARDPEAAAMIQKFFAAIHAQAEPFFLESLLADLLALVLGRWADAAPPQPSKGRTPEGGREAVDRAKAFVRANFTSRIGLDEVAEAACLSPCHLQRVFTALTGVSPHEYTIQCRVRKARELLRQGLSPAETALAVGFFDQSHLSAHFRRIVGVPPGGFTGREAEAE